MTKVSLHVNSEPYEIYHGHCITSYHEQIIGEVKLGDEVLHKEERISDDDKPDTVRRAKEDMAIQIEIWAVENTDFMPA